MGHASELVAHAGSPILYPQIERLIELLGCEDALVIPTITLIHLSVIPVTWRATGRSSSTTARTRRSTTAASLPPRCRPAHTVKRFRFEDPDDLEQLLRQDTSSTRLVCMDGVNSMTGNARTAKDFARVARLYDAILYVDDAHGFGVIGERERG